MKQVKVYKKHFFFFLIISNLSLLISGCGFTPMYATSPDAYHPASLTQIEIANISDRSGQFLRNELVDRLNASGTPGSPLYRLDMQDLSEKTRDLDVTVRSDSTREQMKLGVRLLLTDLQSGDVILDKKLSAAGSYNVLEREYATRIARQSLRETLLRKLAEQTERAIALALSPQK